MSEALGTLIFRNQNHEVCWYGYKLAAGTAFDSFMSTNVASRFCDREGSSDFELHLRGLAVTEFSQNSLKKILAAEVEEERDWVVGEAMAEAWLSSEYDVIWPWNMERDKRTPKASLPGADLVGFYEKDDEIRLLIGEVKTSGENKNPPQVMSGRSGMGHQIDRLCTCLELISTLLRWLWPRCKGTKYQPYFDASVKTYLNSDNKALSLYGVLIRDTEANELDLKARGKSLGDNLRHPTTCHLIALYIPCDIAELLSKVKGGEAS